MTKKVDPGPADPDTPSARPGRVRGLEPPAILAYIDAVGRHGSIRRAADALHVASSALNRRILDVEDALGLPLFERLPRGVRATAAGEAFLAYARRALRELRSLEAQLDGLRGLKRGRVSIAVAESVTGRLLPDAIAEYQASHPAIAFSITVAGPRGLVDDLLKDVVDLILTHEQPDIGTISVLSSAPQPLCAMVAPEHPLARREALRLRDCVPFPIAMPDHTLAARALLDAAMDRSSIQLEPAIVSNSIEATKIFARTSRGVCFSFRVGSKPDLSGMVSIPLADPGLGDARLFLASRRGRVLPVAAASFAEQLSAALEDL